MKAAASRVMPSRTSRSGGSGSTSTTPPEPVASSDSVTGTGEAIVKSFTSNTNKCEKQDFNTISEIARVLEDTEVKKNYLKKMNECKQTYLVAVKKDNENGNTNEKDKLLEDIIVPKDKQRTTKFMENLKVEGQLEKFQKQIEESEKSETMKKNLLKT